MRHPGHLPPNTANMANPAKPSNLRHLPPRTLPQPSNIRALHPRPDDIDYPPLLPATDARQARLDEIGFVVMMGLVYTVILGLLALWLASEADLDVRQLLWALAARLT